MKSKSARKGEGKGMGWGWGDLFAFSSLLFCRPSCLVLSFPTKHQTKPGTGKGGGLSDCCRLWAVGYGLWVVGGGGGLGSGV